VLFVGDDWAEDHHDVEVQDEAGRRLGKAKLAEGIAGIARLHELLAEHLDANAEAEQVVIGIETDRGPWVQALLAAGYQVWAINPLQVARYRERRSVSGAKSDAADAYTLADMVRTDRHQLRPIAGDSDLAEAIKVVARAHKTLIWERTRHTLRLRVALREFFPAALDAFAELAAAEALELLGRAPDPVSAGRLTTAQITAALKRARRHHAADKAQAIRVALRAEHLTQPTAVVTAYAATVRAQVAILATLNTEITRMQEQVEAHFGRHPDAEIYRSQPGLGQILGARVLAEFGDDPPATPTPDPARTTPPPARSPANPARRSWCWPAMSTTTGWSTPSSGRPTAPSPHQRAPAPTTTSSAAAASATTPPCASSPTGWSASSTAASRRAPPTTRQPPGRTATSRRQLDNQMPWDVCQRF
jgi:transposase